MKFASCSCCTIRWNLSENLATNVYHKLFYLTTRQSSHHPLFGDFSLIRVDYILSQKHNKPQINPVDAADVGPNVL